MASPFSGPRRRVCEALVATPSEYGDEELHRRPRRGALPRARRRARAARQRDRRPHRRRRDRPMALVGHLDTVPNWPGGTTRVEGDRIVGRGTADMKGGVAVMLRLLERFAEPPAPVSSRLLRPRGGAEPAERHPRACWPTGACSRSPTFAVVLEPTGEHRARRRGRDDERRRRLPRQARAQRAAVAGRERDLRGGGRARPVRGAQGGAGRGRGPHVPRHDHRHPRARRRRPQRRARRVPAARSTCASRPAATLDDARARGGGAGRRPGEVRVARRVAVRRCPTSRSRPCARSSRRPASRCIRSRPGPTSRRCRRRASRPLNYGPGEASQAHQREEWVSIAALEHCEQVLAGYLAALMRGRALAGSGQRRTCSSRRRRPTSAALPAATTRRDGVLVLAAVAGADVGDADHQPRRLRARGVRQRHAHGGAGSSRSATGSDAVRIATARRRARDRRPRRRHRHGAAWPTRA